MTAPLSLDELTKLVKSGEIDTVVVGATDMQGRLQGKRIHAPFFIEDTKINKNIKISEK